jgi:hypothetical protein
MGVLKFKTNSHSHKEHKGFHKVLKAFILNLENLVKPFVFFV